MKQEIIYTEHYALIISDEQIKDVRPFIGRYHLEKGLIINQFPTYLTDLSECKLIIAHRPLTDAPILKGVPLLPEFIQDDDVEELAKDKFPYLGSEQVKSDQNRHTDNLRHGFKTGYNKAKETYEYTLGDLRRAFTTGRDLIVEKRDKFGEWEVFTKFIDSLQQSKRPKYFECEVEQLNNKPGSSYGTETLYRSKTIINSKGQTELVGECIYE
jgi:hypothetical protein